MSRIPVYVACLGDNDRSGIYRLILDTLKGKLEDPCLYEPCIARSLCYQRYVLAHTYEEVNQTGIALLDTHQEKPYHLDRHITKQSAPTYITMEGSAIYTVNANSGLFTVYHRDHGSLQVQASISLGKDARCHHVTLIDDDVYLSCFGQDQIQVFDQKHGYAFVKQIALPNNSGPHRLLVNRQTKYAYMLCQKSNEVLVYRMDSQRRFHCEQMISVLPNGWKQPCTTVSARLSPNARYLYTATQGADIITCFEIINGNLRQKTIFQSGGHNLSDFIIDETGRWMILLHQGSDQIILYQLDPEQGEAIMNRSQICLPSPIALTLGYRI